MSKAFCNATTSLSVLLVHSTNVLCISSKVHDTRWAHKTGDHVVEINENQSCIEGKHQLEEDEKQASIELKALQADQTSKEFALLRSALRTHLTARIHSLSLNKSLLAWWIVRLKDSRTHEHSLYWKLVFASPSTPIDQYAFQLAYYHMEYQSKRYASNGHSRCKGAGECQPTSLRKECAWLDDQTTWS